MLQTFISDDCNHEHTSLHYVIKAVWDSLAMELIPNVFLVTIDWWSEITTSVIKRGTLKSLYKNMRQPNEHFKLLQVQMNL